ncbi:MAG: NAD+ synthase [Ardenticatenaceae bacterium]|nr:NAD+ synthase [Ardenticatenaceae bacterium]HBY96369.1 NAD+ synthase [Chloroflexota bacterium]
MRPIRLALGQINCTVGNVAGNTRKILDAIERARARGADIVILPELALSGYPPEDLLLKPDFIEANRHALEDVARAARGLVVIVGYPAADDYDLYNAAAVLQDGAVLGVYRKHFLPNYGVFDENRYFAAGQSSPLFDFAGDIVGVNICEDIWYPAGPAQSQALSGAELLLNVSASPYHRGKGQARERMLATRAADNVAIVAYCNLVGGQDELVFDGWSLVFGPDGSLLARGPAFEEALLLVDLNLDDVFRERLHDPRSRKERAAMAALTGIGESVPRIAGATLHQRHDSERAAVEPTIAPVPGPVEEVYQALVLGTRDYVRKNSFKKAVLGLSGGIDSALTATIATDALGSENVIGVSMLSRFSSEGSKSDAEKLAENLGIALITIPIERPFQAFLDALNGPPDAPFADTPFGVAEENLQARVRGMYLMSLSNKFGWLVLTTGNKSENAVGYATLYGDMAGGFAVIKDVFKTLVYELARWRNRDGEVIPESSITKAPSAELRPGQKDVDTLPPYPVLDPVLQMYVEEDFSGEQIVAAGFDPETVERVIRMVDTNEFKRRQAPPGIKITTRAFGKDRRLPITNRYRTTVRFPETAIAPPPAEVSPLARPENAAPGRS